MTAISIGPETGTLGGGDGGLDEVRRALRERRAGYSLPRLLYLDEAAFRADLTHIWQREWIFAGHAAELVHAGDYFTLGVGGYSLIVVRNADGTVRALHNVCRHRGSIVCDAASGSARRRFVCPYHQWSYELDGRLAHARDAGDDIDVSGLALGSAHCIDVGGLIFVCVAPEPPDAGPLQAMVEAYLTPFELRSARVAHQTTFVERGNWKLVLENNRECYHCRRAHPELCATFPDNRIHSGGGTADEVRELDQLVTTCEQAGLPSRFAATDDFGYRVMRMPLHNGARSMTLDGTPAVGRRFGALPDVDVGDLLLYHYPSSWCHFMADHAVTVRVLPLGPTATELRTTWLVPTDAVAGADYDLGRLTEVWQATNAQDTTLVERAQRGVTSPAYRPGPYAPLEEEGVIQFVEWYLRRIIPRLEQ